MKTHEGDRYFKCNQCDFATVSLRQFDIHHHMMHTGEQPYKCDGCKLAYKSKRQLMRHRRQYHFEELTSEELTELQDAGDDESEDDECAACLKIYERYQHHGDCLDTTSEGQVKEEEDNEGKLAVEEISCIFNDI